MELLSHREVGDINHFFASQYLSVTSTHSSLSFSGEDGTVKLWNSQSGFCYVTLPKSHTAAITAVEFANPTVVLSASLDGTVRAHE